jgi:hypothetical protein
MELPSGDGEGDGEGDGLVMSMEPLLPFPTPLPLPLPLLLPFLAVGTAALSAGTTPMVPMDPSVVPVGAAGYRAQHTAATSSHHAEHLRPWYTTYCLRGSLCGTNTCTAW